MEKYKYDIIFPIQIAQSFTHSFTFSKPKNINRKEKIDKIIRY